MKCEAVQNRLLALPDPAGGPADLRAHLDGCDLCRRYADRAAALDAELAALPAPASDDARAAFLDSLTAAGPVIRSVPVVPAGARWAWRPRVPARAWKPVGGLAAAVAVGVGLWAARPAKGPERDYAEGRRHELLTRVVALDARLAKAEGPEHRIPVLTEMAVALKDETGGVYKADRGRDEVRSLADLFEKVVRGGIVKQAGEFPRFAPVAERHQVLNAAADALAVAATDAAAMARSAPPQVQESLDRMARTAREGQDELRKLARGV